MGQVRRTSQNLEIVQIRKDDNVILVRGNFPGSEGDYCVIRECTKISNSSARLKRIKEVRAAALAGGSTDKKADKKAAAAKAKK
jgi:ribosomal protein L24